jgi:hypothetical protein
LRFVAATRRTCFKADRRGAVNGFGGRAAGRICATTRSGYRVAVPLIPFVRPTEPEMAPARTAR